MENEIWKAIEGFEGLYEISNMGRVKSLARVAHRPKVGPLPVKEKIRCTPLNTSGYPSIFLSKDGVTTQFRIHRLVAQAFIPNPDNLPQVNHLNNVKTDNRAENLEWITLLGNVYHAVELYGSKWGSHHNHNTGIEHHGAQPILIISPDGSKMYFQTVKEAARELGLKRTTVNARITGQCPPIDSAGTEYRRITKEQFLTYINN
jgi:hypothetical protein